MKNLKKLLLLVLALTLVATMLLTACKKDDEGTGAPGGGGEAARNEFIDSIGGVSETFEGAVSEMSYASAEAAANAYVSIEVVGEKNAVIVDTVSNGELDSADIARLNIPEEFQEGMQSVEEVEVTYTATEGNTSPLAADNAQKTVKVYVIKYTVDWKYFTPRPENGSTITKTYYDSVFNSEQYRNCTMSYTNKIVIDMGQGMEEYSMEITVDQLIKYDGDKIYAEISTVDVDGTQTNSATVYLYMETTGSSVKCYVKNGQNGNWVQGSLSTIGFNTVEELRPFYDQYLDYTYFTKTDYGFMLSHENSEAYMRQALAQSGVMDMLGMGDLEIDMFAEYYVKNGVLSGMRTDADIQITVSEGGYTMTIDEKVEAVVTCTNYGTTVVTNPMQ